MDYTTVIILLPRSIPAPAPVVHLLVAAPELASSAVHQLHRLVVDPTDGRLGCLLRRHLQGKLGSCWLVDSPGSRGDSVGCREPLKGSAGNDRIV